MPKKTGKSDKASSTERISSALLQGDNNHGVQKNAPFFRLTDRNVQCHRQPLYCLSWCTDIHVDSYGHRFHYLATCGHNSVSIYEVELGNPRGTFEVKQSYKDYDENEQFYACTFGGRSRYISNGPKQKNRPEKKAWSVQSHDKPNSSDSDLSPSSNSDQSENGDNEENKKRARTEYTPSTILLNPENCPETNYLQLDQTESSFLGPQLLCVSGVSAIIKVIDPVQKKQIASLRGHGNDIYDLKVSPVDEHLLLSASVDESIRLWNLRSFACVAIFSGQHGHREAVLSLSWHAMGDRFASSGTDKSIRLWSLSDGKVNEALQASMKLNPAQIRQSFHPATLQFPYFATYKAHMNFVDCVQFLGDLILSKSTYNSIVLWAPVLPEGSTPTCTAGAAAYSPPSDIMMLRIFYLHECHIWFVRFAIDSPGKLLAVGTIEGEVDVWDIDSCVKRPSQRLKAVTKSTIRALAFSPDGKILATCSDGAQVCKWNEW